MLTEKLIYLGRILLIASEVSLITFLDYAIDHYLPIEYGEHISLDILYCLPVIQTARLAAIHATRRTDTQTSTIVGLILALVLSGTEAALSWPFPVKVLALNVFTRSVVFTVIGRVMVKLWREREYARKDMLTGLSNRVEFVERLRVEQERSERSGNPYSVLFIDVDQFKLLNDDHGHRVGDQALQMLADILQDNTRKVDVVSRLGGDEFVLLLPDTDEQSRDVLAGRIQQAADHQFQGRLWPISLSIGRATETGSSHGEDWVIRTADEDMYQIKRAKQQEVTASEFAS